MVFRFGTHKVIQAAAVLLRLERGRMSYLRLLKLLYIADREYLSATGRPIIGTRLVAMKQGPLHSEVYDLVKGGHSDEPLWARFFQKDGYHIELKEDPGVLSLSRKEIDTLTAASEERAMNNEWEIVEETHDFQEWKNSFQQGTSATIPFEDLIDAVGRSGDKEEILQGARDKAAMDRVFRG